MFIQYYLIKESETEMKLQYTKQTEDYLSDFFTVGGDFESTQDALEYVEKVHAIATDNETYYRYCLNGYFLMSIGPDENDNRYNADMSRIDYSRGQAY